MRSIGLLWTPYCLFAELASACAQKGKAYLGLLTRAPEERGETSQIQVGYT
jgi:hypothetical protein